MNAKSAVISTMNAKFFKNSLLGRFGLIQLLLLLQILLFERMKSLKKEASLQYLPDSLHAAMSVGSVHKGLYHAQQNSILFKKIKDRFS